MDELLQEIGERVRQARLAKHMSQLDLAEAIGMSVSFAKHEHPGIACHLGCVGCIPQLDFKESF